ncbi:MAG: tetratricopeptide repeat protein [Thermodesulfobacteriota bacterium]
MTEPDLFTRASEAWDAGNLKEAFDLFHEAVKNGDSSSQLNLGYFYDEGIGVKKDIKKALYWYKKAARNGDPGAMSNIAIYYRSIGNIRRAKFWFLKGIDICNGGDDALEIAKIYLSRKGKANIKKAIYYLNLVNKTKYVSEAGIEEAEELLGSLKDVEK